MEVGCKTRLIVHGGAWSIPDEYVEAHIKGVKTAIDKVFPDLESGKITALDAVEQCIRILEEDETFDAGKVRYYYNLIFKGSFLNADGEVELDAIIMEGKNLKMGAVAAIKNVVNPITVARKVMENTDHCLLVGHGAQQFISKMGIPTVPTEELLTKRELELYEEIKHKKDFTMRTPFEERPKGTVGCVALDVHGNLACGTSTGGLPRKLPGRVGDAPLVGSGAYVDNELGGCSATGWGESIMRVVLCKSAVDRMQGKSSSEAVKEAIQYLERRVDGKAGLISIDRFGNYGIHYNTMRMAFAYAEEKTGKTIAAIDFK